MHKELIEQAPVLKQLIGHVHTVERERKEDESPHIGGCVLGHRGEWGDRWQARAGWNLAACCKEKPKKSVISLDVGQERTHTHMHVSARAHSHTLYEQGSTINLCGNMSLMK